MIRRSVDEVKRGVGLHPLQVRVLESRRILQPVSDRPVHADVREPDQRHLDVPAGAVEDADDADETGSASQWTMS